jgi:mitochondrial fission protein ELM1
MTAVPKEKTAMRGEEIPSVWLLLDDRPGHTTQAVGLAEALGWPYETKTLAFTPLNRIDNRLLGASRLGLDPRHSELLAPPWPDLVIAMGRRSAPIARWIKKMNGGQTRIVQLGRKAVNLAAPFDLSIACKHFQLPPHPGRVDLVVPLTQVTPARLAAAGADWPALMAGRAEPRVVLLLGGTTAQHRLSAETAGRMAREIMDHASALGGSLTIVTSRRSGAAAVAAMEEAAPEAAFHLWRRGQKENPYLAFLAQADILVVSGESESMLAEAAATGKPLLIYPIPEKPLSAKARLQGAIFSRAAEGRGTLGRFCAGLIAGGWITPPRDLVLMHREMIAHGLAEAFGAAVKGARPLPAPAAGPGGGPDDWQALLDRVRALVAR